MQKILQRYYRKFGATQSNSQENMPKAIKKLPILIPKKEKTVSHFFQIHFASDNYYVHTIKCRWMVPRLAAYGFFQQFSSGFEVCWWYTPAVGRPPPSHTAGMWLRVC